MKIIDQCVAQGVPFAREYGGLLDNRSFGGAQVSRTFYARGQTGQQLLLGAYQALERQIAAGTVEMHTRHEMLELIVVDGKARGVVVRDMVTGEIETHFADAVVLATGGYGNVFYLSTNAMGCNVTATWRAHRKGALLRQPLLHPDPPDLHPGVGRLPVQADADERVAAQRRPHLGARRAARTSATRGRSPRTSATTTWSASTRRSATWCPATSPPARPRTSATRAAASGPAGSGVYLDFADAIAAAGPQGVEAKYGNLFDMYAQITGENPYETPMRIYPAVHYTMGGLWVDYDLQSTIPGLFVIGEANFSDHGANRLGASALMQGLADGYFVLPNTINDYLAAGPFAKVDASHPAAVEAVEAVQGPGGEAAADQRHPHGGLLPPGARPDHVGLLRHGADRGGPAQGHRPDPGAPGGVLDRRQGARPRATRLNQTLERAGRVADFIELGELMCIDALPGANPVAGTSGPRARPRTARRCATTTSSPTSRPGSSAAEGGKPVLHKEPLVYEYVDLKQRSYK